MADARFEDGGESPLRLIAATPEDLGVVSALLQDAVLTLGDLEWDRRQRRFGVLLNRFRWEDEPLRSPPERVRSLLVIENATRVASMGIDPKDREQVISILSVTWQETEEGAGVLTLVLAGDGALRIETEALELRLKDVTQPYVAPSGKVPRHAD